MRKTHYIPITADIEGAADKRTCALIRRTIRTALAAEGMTLPCEVDVLLTDDEGIHRINLDMRNVDRPTDVLSFPEFDLTPEELRPIALSYLKPKRMPHVLGTEQEAVRLAERYGADVTKARIAALLHDCTKKLDMDEQLALCKKYHIPLDELERKALKLLHSKTGAAIARDVFAVDDDVYNAILYHTTGKPDMTLLEKIIYLADYIEPTRDFPGVEALRRTVYEDLDRGLLMGLTMTIDEMEEMGNPVHHMTRDARDYLMKRGIS